MSGLVSLLFLLSGQHFVSPHAPQTNGNVINHMYKLRIILPDSYMLMFTVFAAGGASRAALLVEPATLVTTTTLLSHIF
jgi:hypothetical protein